MKTILETLAEDGSFTTLLATLSDTGLDGKLAGSGSFTLFAPNDTAFERVNLEEINKEKGGLSSVLCYHMVSGRLTAEEVAGNHSLSTESGKSLTVRRQAGEALIDNSRYVKTDIVCSNGIIHVMDNVFLPQFSGWYCGGCC